jgi:hypothetical protein
VRRPRGPLWHNGDFLLLCGAQSISEVGSQITGLALPLAAIFVLPLLPSPLRRIRDVADAERESASVGDPVST